MATLTRSAVLSSAQRMPFGPIDLGLPAFPQQPPRSHSWGTSVSIRLADANDAEMLQSYVRELSATARYNRFLAAVRELPPVELASATGMNERNRGTLIAEIAGHRPVMVGELRYAISSNATCEFAISVADSWRRKRLGTLLLNRLLSALRATGVETLVGEVLRSNEAMLAFARNAGFGIAPRSGDPRTVQIVRNISDPSSRRYSAREQGCPDRPHRACNGPSSNNEALLVNATAPSALP
jgi:GNAT superfamily N-acetyltransferase